MRLSFLNRSREMAALRMCFAAPEGTLSCVYGRRRCGKSRLLLEAVRNRQAVYYVADDRDDALQKASLSAEIARLIAGFDKASYDDWDALLERWWHDAPPDSVLILDEFPSLASAAPELPSIIQKKVDSSRDKAVHVVLCGSSQRMMQGLVLDHSAPLYGRARAIIEVKPLGLHWLAGALGLKDPADVVAHYAVWGGVPRYWELALDSASLKDAVRSLVLDPIGVLHKEPDRLLRDDLRDVTRSATILSLIGQGCHRVSEIAGRLAKPATALARPIQRLLELGLITREIPFGCSARDSKRSFYSIGDPFLRFWFRYVEPNHSELDSGRIETAEADIWGSWNSFMGGIWEELSRLSVPHLSIHGLRWRSASRWWGMGLNRQQMEVDVVALSEDGKALLVGEVRLSVSPRDIQRLERNIEEKSRQLPFSAGKKIVPAVWSVGGSNPGKGSPLSLISARDVMAVLK